MKLSIICFSLTGLHTSERLKQGLEGRGHTVVLAKKSKYLEDSIKESAGCWTEKRFVQDDGIIFVGACGIAVRSIAPFVASKKSDPAVLVIDECGQFVISLLSGHLGGANALALEAASILKAQPVVTTATDLHNRFAVDVFAKKNGCEIINMKTAKEVSAALLAGEQVGFYSEFPWKGVLPEGLVLCDQDGIPAAEEDLPHVCDLFFTGEGRIDRQTAMGKAPGGAAAAARALGVPAVALGGSVSPEAGAGFDGVFGIQSGPVSLETALDPARARQELARTAEQVTRLAMAAARGKHRD